MMSTDLQPGAEARSVDRCGARLHLVDCTLREGDQAPGVAFTPDEKLRIAGLLDAAGVELADAGMPEQGPAEVEVLRELVTRADRMRIAASVRCLHSAVALARDTSVHAVIVICPVSRLHLHGRLGIRFDALLTRIRELADMCAGGPELQIVAEDATRADAEDLRRFYDHVGALAPAVVYLADTTGCALPSSMGALAAEARRCLPAAVGVGVHAHDDFGMATANTLAAIEAGATWPTACVNGLGERAGNADLGAVAAATALLLGRPTGLRLTAMPELSEVVEVASGQWVSPRAPLVGETVFRHESGIHVDGVLKDPRNYESLSPAEVGRQRELVLGKHSGRALLRALLRDRDPQRAERTSDDVLERVRVRLSEQSRGRSRGEFHAVRAQLHAWARTHNGQEIERFFKLLDEVQGGR